jgi:hypothetical protein
MDISRVLKLVDVSHPETDPTAPRHEAIWQSLFVLEANVVPEKFVTYEQELKKYIATWMLWKFL